MEKNQATTSFEKWKPIEIMLALLFLVAPFYYHPNIGGGGLRIPNNITVLMTATVVIWYSFYLVLKRPTFVLPKYFLYVAAFPVLIILSGFVTGVEQPLKWLFRLLYIWGGFAFFFSLFQHGLKQGRFDRILFIVVISALLQGLVGIAQTWLQTDMPFGLSSPGGVPNGLFQQVNNQATYQVTAIMVAIYLSSRPLLAKGSLWMQAMIVVTVVSSIFLVTQSGSRIGLLGLIIGLMIIIPALWQRLKLNKGLSVLLLIALIIGGTLGVMAENKGNRTVVDKTVAMQSGYSGSIRLGIYRIALDLVTQKPLFGHGIGSFSSVWQNAKPDFYQSYPDSILPPNLVSHPHNELLFWFVEGGVIAVVGLAIFSFGLVLALTKKGWRRGGAYTAMLLPIGLHTQVELPFYSSVIHWFLFVVLLAAIFHGLTTIKASNMSGMAVKTISYCGTAFILIIILFLAQTMRAQFDFYNFYHSPISKQISFENAYMNPYFRKDAEWISMSSNLYSSIELGLNDNVKAYTKWGEVLILERPDVALYKKLADAYLSLGDREAFCSIVRRGLLLYPENTKLKQLRSNCIK
jgi:O-antigen ligase